MKKSSVLMLLAALFIAAVMIFGCSSDKKGPATTGGTVTFKLGHVGPPIDDHPWQKFAKKYADEVEKATQGRVKIQTYPASQLGADREMAEGIQNGTLDMAMVSTMAAGNFVKEFGVWDLPYIWPNDNAKVDRILENSPVKDKIIEAAAKKRINILGFYENDWRAMTNSKKPISQPSDLAGLKMRIVENKPSMSFFKGVGAIPTPMSFAELYTGMQQGTVDGQDNGAILTLSNKFWEVQKYFTNTRHIYCPLAVMISDAALAKLSDADKATLKKLAVEIGREQRAYSREWNARSEKEMESKMKVTKLTPEQLKKFQEASKGTYAAMEADLGKDLIASMLAEREK